MSTKKGMKRIKNTPVFYEETKKQRSVLLTDTAWIIAGRKAKENGISASEYIERLLKTTR